MSGPPCCLKRQASDASRFSDDVNHGCEDLAASNSKAVRAELSSETLRVVFLDIDGVLAPRLNAGQLVRQCVDGVVAICHAARAKIVLTSSWRLLPGKPEEFDDLLARFHDGADLLYDVTPNLSGVPAKELDAGDAPTDASEFLDGSRFVRIAERSGLTVEGAMATHRLLSDEADDEAVACIFSDPDYDTHVYSEATGEYSRASFSPRSREGADWSHEPCSPEFAKTRCREIACWLQAAEACGVHVTHWAVLDDDDLLQTGEPPCKPVRRTVYSKAPTAPPPKAHAEPAHVAEEANRLAPLAKAIDDDDMGWEFSF